MLARHRVRYLVVRGEAVIYYGHARLTGDIDLFYDTGATNVKRLFAMLKEFWNDDIPGIQSEQELGQKGMVFQFGIPPNRIDLITVLEGIKFTPAWKNRTVESLSRRGKRFSIYYIGLNELIANKQAVGRERDKDDLRFLTMARRKGKK